MKCPLLHNIWVVHGCMSKANGTLEVPIMSNSSRQWNSWRVCVMRAFWKEDLNSSAHKTSDKFVISCEEWEPTYSLFNGSKRKHSLQLCFRGRATVRKGNIYGGGEQIATMKETLQARPTLICERLKEPQPRIKSLCSRCTSSFLNTAMSTGYLCKTLQVFEFSLLQSALHGEIWRRTGQYVTITPIWLW